MLMNRVFPITAQFALIELQRKLSTVCVLLREWISFIYWNGPDLLRIWAVFFRWIYEFKFDVQKACTMYRRNWRHLHGHGRRQRRQRSEKVSNQQILSSKYTLVADRLQYSWMMEFSHLRLHVNIQFYKQSL